MHLYTEVTKGSLIKSSICDSSGVNVHLLMSTSLFSLNEKMYSFFGERKKNQSFIGIPSFLLVKGA